MIADTNLRSEIDLLLQITNSGKQVKKIDKDAVSAFTNKTQVHNPSHSSDDEPINSEQ
jgi:hypothetical protein